MKASPAVSVECFPRNLFVTRSLPIKKVQRRLHFPLIGENKDQFIG